MACTGSSRELPEVPSPKSSETLVPQPPDRAVEQLNDDALDAHLVLQPLDFAAGHACHGFRLVLSDYFACAGVPRKSGGRKNNVISVYFVLKYTRPHIKSPK